MATHFSVDYNYMPRSYSVNLSRVLATIESILPNYRFEDRSEILNVSYFDEMNHTILMDLAACLAENYQNNSDLAWMGNFCECTHLAYAKSEQGSEETESIVKNMYKNLLADKPYGFDCLINDNWSILYDLYSPDSDSAFKEN